MNTEVIMVPTSELMAFPNVRFGLKKERVAALAESIEQFGRVHTPVKVEILSEPGPRGEKYGIIDGNYRHAAATLLNKKGAGLELPCVVEDHTEGVDRLRLQLSSNTDRTDMSPMDEAVAIKTLLDSGLNKTETRELFKRPGLGGKRVPMSNALLNMYVSFLYFPKPIQTKIHEGVLGVAKAYKLSKTPKELWNDIVKEAEETRDREFEEENKMEEKFLAEQRKQEETEAKLKADKEALQTAEKLAADAEAALHAKMEEAAVAYKAQQAAAKADKETKARVKAEFEAKESEAKAAEKALVTTTEAVEKLRRKVESAVQTAADRKAKLEHARKELVAKAKSGKVDTEKATAKVTTGFVPLKPAEIHKLIEAISLPGSFPKVTLIGVALRKAFAGETTDAQLTSELGWITGERKDKPKHLKG